MLTSSMKLRALVGWWVLIDVVEDGIPHAQNSAETEHGNLLFPIAINPWSEGFEGKW